MAAGFDAQGAKALNYDELLCVEAELEHKGAVAAINQQVQQNGQKLCMSTEAADQSKSRHRQLMMELRTENALHYGRFPVDVPAPTADALYVPPDIPTWIVEGRA